MLEMVGTYATKEEALEEMYQVLVRAAAMATAVTGRHFEVERQGNTATVRAECGCVEVYELGVELVQ